MKSYWKIKQKRYPAYRNFVGNLPCSIPGCKEKSQAHHEQKEGDGCMGSKCCDSRCIPMCFSHHRNRHDMGRTFWFVVKLEPETLILKTQQLWVAKGKTKFWE